MFDQFSKVLVAYDDSELSKQAVDAALKLAQANPKLEITVVTVLETYAHSYVESYVYYEEILQQSRAQAKEMMNHLAEEKLNSVENKTNLVILEGHPARKIVEYAEEYQPDLLIIGSRGLSGLKEFVLGSVSNKVVQSSKCPVLIMK